LATLWLDYFTPPLRNAINALFFIEYSWNLAKYKVSAILAEHSRAPIWSSNCGIGQSSIAWAIDSIANPHLNNKPDTIIVIPGKANGQVILACKPLPSLSIPSVFAHQQKLIRHVV
jgi:hypothetical protein